MSDKLQEINHENAVKAMHNYLYTWDLVGVITEAIKDDEDRHALLNVLEGSEILLKQLEQAQEKNKRLKADKRKLQAVYDENYAKAAHRAGVIEDLQAANQKLVECLEWYADKENRNRERVVGGGTIYLDSAVMVDNGDMAEQTLSEVKGND